MGDDLTGSERPRGTEAGASLRTRRRARARRRARLRRTVLVAALAGVTVALILVYEGGGPPARPSRSATGPSHVASPAGTASTASPAGTAGTAGTADHGAAAPFPPPSKNATPGPNLAPGSDPSVLPSDVLIADEGNDRLLVVNPSGTIVWEFSKPGPATSKKTFLSPDDAFFTPTGSNIIATEESDDVVSLINVRKRQFLWRYGTPGVAGSAANQLSNPDDAMVLPDGDTILADIKNCSLLLIGPGKHSPLERIGVQDTSCEHDPPLRFGSPNGAFPLTNGNFVVTEINGDWADEMTLSGRVLWSTHPPGVAYPSDTNEIRPGVYLTVDYSSPGQIIEFNKTGKLLWRYGPSSGPGMLNHPSLCEPIQTNGDILCNDDYNDRVIVVDPRTDKIVWQYGHTGVTGSAPGYLSEPDGVDLAPPYSTLVRHRSTLGTPSLRCASGIPPGACTVFGSGGAGAG